MKKCASCLFGVVLLSALAVRAENLPISSEHVRLVAYDLMDRTDDHDELVFTREWLLSSIEKDFAITANVVSVEETLTGRGAALLRLAPLPHARMTKDADLLVRGPRRRRTFEVISNGYPSVIIPYEGGRIGLTRALHAAQRKTRPYKEGRDGLFLSNTWGGGFRDAHVNEAFLMKEIEAAAELGVDVVEIDDGWQKGRSMNSVLANGKGVWNGYWAVDPNFWDPDSVRFPNGFAPLLSALRARGLKMGLWYGPDSSNDAANWSRDADRLLAYYRDGITYFKIDSMKSTSAKALANQRALFDRLIRESNGEIVIDLDVTAEIRPGYFGLMDAGTIFVENRYPTRHRYWPHHTLRNFWSLAQVVDPVRLRMEVANPDAGADLYADDPLAPALWRADTLFATVMLSSPLGWFESSALSEARRAELRPLVSVWKRERANLHGGWTHSVGEKPDGVVWTGFVTEGADGSSVYALLFRELSDCTQFSLDLSPYLPKNRIPSNPQVLGGRGKCALEGSRLSVEGVEKLDFIWVKMALGE